MSKQIWNVMQNIIASIKWILLLCFVGSNVYAQSVRGPITVGEVELVARVLEYSKAEAAQIIQYENATHIKLHIAELKLASGDTITVSNPDGTEVYTYPGSDFTTDGGPGFWAMSISGDTAVVRLNRQSLSAIGEDIVIDKYTRGYPQEVIEAAFQTESICGKDDKKDVACYKNSHSTAFNRSKSVARMLLNNGTSLCTGWRIGPNKDTMMTNEHCITSQSAVNAAEAQFNYQRPNCRGGSISATKVSGKKLLADNNTLDFALFTINNANAVSKFGALQLDVRKPKQNEKIYFPQHPGGSPKKFGIESDRNNGNVCRIDKAIVNGRGTNTDTAYFCDSEGGSSGSPILAAGSNKVIALHHFGGCTNQGVRIDLIWPKIKSFLGGSGSSSSSSSSTSSSGGGECNTTGDCNAIYDGKLKNGWKVKKCNKKKGLCKCKKGKSTKNCSSVKK